MIFFFREIAQLQVFTVNLSYFFFFFSYLLKEEGGGAGILSQIFII